MVRLTIGILHIVDVELGKIAGDNPSRVLRHLERHGITLSLLEWGELCAIGLRNGLPQVFAKRFLLNHHARGWYHHIDERSVVELCLLLKLQEQRRIFHAEHLGDEFGPEHLAFALFIATPFPATCKFPGCLSLLLLGFHLQMILSCKCSKLLAKCHKCRVDFAVKQIDFIVKS